MPVARRRGCVSAPPLPGVLPPPSLRFCLGLDDLDDGGGEEENELATLELIHSLVETLDKYFGNVCELDLMYHIDKAHYILDEMIVNGCIVDTNKANILTPTRRCSALWNDVGEGEFPPAQGAS